MPDTTPTSAARQRVAWRDTFDVWPYLSVTFKVFPWHWRFGFRHDGPEMWWVNIGPLQIDYGHNPGFFPLERVPNAE